MSATIPESHLDLLNTGVAILSTQGKKGFPQTTALWFLYDEGKIKISLNTTRQKTKNLQANPNCTFFILDPANPVRTLEVRGTSTIAPDTDYAFADKVGQKYGANLRAMDAAGGIRVVATLEPVKVNAINLAA